MAPFVPAAHFKYNGTELGSMEAAVRYHRAVATAFAPYLGARVLEVGAGIGTFATHLRACPGVRTLCLLEPAEEQRTELLRRFADAADSVQVDGRFLEEFSGSGVVDSVVAVNVLEHVEHDVEFLAAARRLVGPSGHVCIYAPALPALFGTLDRAFDHYRRYTRRSLTTTFRAAGLEPAWMHYTNLPGVLSWFLAGRVLRKTTLSARDVTAYDRLVMPLVHAMERIAKPPLGQSLITVARPAR